VSVTRPNILPSTINVKHSSDAPPWSTEKFPPARPKHAERIQQPFRLHFEQLFRQHRRVNVACGQTGDLPVPGDARPGFQKKIKKLSNRL
jgi:hypothetical protein